MKKHFW